MNGQVIAVGSLMFGLFVAVGVSFVVVVIAYRWLRFYYSSKKEQPKAG